MANIHILPEYLANQIAAGEVVQRPESVVKELVENAVDAGATAISVVVRDAGKQLIHVIDNGGGMSKDDLAMSVVRHATSKIKTESDLHAIRTLGFRGEALASIAAVADVEIRTKLQPSAEDDGVSSTGWVLASRPGEPPDIRPIATSVGTQILVRNLFYNVPARRKFLKSDLTEFRHVSETMQRMALSRTDVRFTFHDGDVLVFDVRPSSLLQRIRDVLGINADRALVPVSMVEDGISVSGYVGLPEIARQSRSGQFLFLNGRPITSRPLAHAILTAYEQLLSTGSHPVFVVNIEIDPNKVDVNVHPQKHEVKFDNERAAYLLIQVAVTKALREADVLPAFLGDLPLASKPLQGLATPAAGGITYVNRLTGEIVHSQTSSSPPPTFPPVRSAHGGAVAAALFTPPPKTEQAPVFQAGSQYILTPTADGVMVIDQHAAHERVIYERVMNKHATPAHAEQALLFSVKITRSPSEIVIVREYLAEFQKLGFRLDILDSTTIEIHSVPTDVQPGNEEQVLGKLIDSLQHGGTIPKERRFDHIATMFAAKQAIRRGDRLGTEEMQTLVENLLKCALPHLTPEGKPTFFLLPFDELSSRLT